MALVLKDRVRETTTVTSTGAATLLGAAAGFQSFNTAIPSGSNVYYCIAEQSGSDWEVGYGTFTAPNQLSRDSVYESSNAGSLVNFSAGVKDVFVTYPAEKAIFEEDNGETLIDGGPITVLGDNVTSPPSFPAELGKFVGNIDLFAQIYNINQNDGANASADFVVYNGLSNGNTFFADVGINSENYTSADYPIFTPNSAYYFSYGDGGSNTSTLFLGSGDDAVKIFAGGLETNNTVVTFGADLNTAFNGNVSVGAFSANGAATFANTVVIEGAAYSNAANITALNQLATKAYVDNATATGIHVHEPVRLEKGSNLVAIYDQPNGAGNGIGATLTNNATQETFVVDGVTTATNDRILVYGQTNGYENGVYVVTDTGSNSTNWVLTRASDADTYSTQDTNALGGGDYFYITSGNTGAGESYICTNEGAITFGTTDITFAQFSASPAYTGTAPINVSGQTISLTGVVDATHGGTGANTVTTGDLLYGSATDTWSKLPIGSGYKSLVVNAGGTQVEWNAVALNQSGAVSGALPATNGGTAQSTYATGDTLYASAANTLSKLTGNQTTTKKFLGQTGTGSASQAPVWEQPAASDITGLAPSATTDTSNASNITSGTLPVGRLTGEYTGITGVGVLANGTWAANTIAVAYGGTGAINATDARTNLGLTIGANVQAYSETLQTVADLSSNGILGRTAANTITATALTTNYIPYGNGTGSFAQSSGLQFDGTNLGLGVTPSAWGSGFKALQINSAAALWAGSGAGGAMYLSDNVYFNGTNRVYLNSSYATEYQQNTGNHSWYVAPSGTAGNTITFTQAMTLDASGNLGIGTSSPITKLQVTGSIYSDNNGLNCFLLNSAGSYYGSIQNDAADKWSLGYAAASGSLGTPVLTWNSSGNVGIGTSSPINNGASYGTLTLNGSIGGVLELTTASISKGQIYTDNTNLVYNANDGVHKWDYQGSEKMRLSTAGGFSVGTTSDPGAGAIYATGNITAYYSDDRLKTKLGGIENALDKVKSLSGFYYEANQTAQDLGYQAVREVGVSAQQVQAVLPEVVKPAPIDQQYLTVDYERLVPLLIEAIKELEEKVAKLEAK